MDFELLVSDVAGWIPSIFQMDRLDANLRRRPILAWNQKDAILYGLQVLGSQKKIIAVNSTNLQTVLDGKLTSDNVFSSDNSIVRVDGNGRVVQQSLAFVSDLGSINIPVGQLYTIGGNPIVQDKYFRFTQYLPSTVWTITHPLNKYPAVSVTDSSGSQYEGQITYVNNTKLILTFSAAFAGYADLN